VTNGRRASKASRIGITFVVCKNLLDRDDLLRSIVPGSIKA
jgi:hypothetical protein